MIIRELQDEIIRLKKEKGVYALSKDCVCHNMQATTLTDVYNCVNGIGGEEMVMSDELISSSRKCIDEMRRLGQ